MDLDELQSVRDRERQTDKLQQLRESFYADAGEFIQGLREERERAAERADDPFDAPAVNRLSDEIDTAEQTVEALYEKRVGKIVKAASFAAADLPAQTDGLTAEEQELFETLVADIERNREHVLDVLAGETGGDATGPDDARTEPPDPAAVAESPEPSGRAEETSGVSAADAMGAPSAEDSTAGTDEGSEPDGDEPPAESDRAIQQDGGTTIERETVQITDEVGDIFGVDEREYELATGDVVTLPSANAAPLVERDAAERLD